MKFNIDINPAQIKANLVASVRFLYILILSLGVFLIFSVLYGIENLIKITYILTKPQIDDIVAIYFLGNIVDILPFVVIFSLAYFAYKLNYSTTSSVISLAVIVGILIYIVFFVVILVSPQIDKFVLNAYKNFASSPSSPKYLFTRSKIHYVGENRIIPILIQEGSFKAVVVRNGKFVMYNNIKIVPYDNGIKLKSLKQEITTIPYEKIIPSSFGKLYERIYRGFLKIATQFPLTRYVQEFSFGSFLNLMLYVQSISIGVMYVVWLFRDYSTTKVILLSTVVSIVGVTFIGFISGVFEFMKFSSYLEFIKDIISGILALAFAVLIVVGAHKVDQILKGRFGG